MKRASTHFWRPSRFLCPLGVAVIAIWAGTGTPVASTGRPGATVDTAISSDADERTIAHVLNRIGFGPRPGNIEQVRRMGLEVYIEEQLYPERIDDRKLAARLADFQTLELGTRELTQQYYLPALPSRADGAEASPTGAGCPARTGQKQRVWPDGCAASWAGGS